MNPLKIVVLDATSTGYGFIDILRNVSEYDGVPPEDAVGRGHLTVTVSERGLPDTGLDLAQYWPSPLWSDI
jgi:hypothetical protein